MADADGLVLAVDQGTGSTKAVLMDADGRVLSRGSTPLSQQHPHPGWVEQSPIAIWESVLTAVAACVPAAVAHRVVGVGFSTQRESLLLWDRATGVPVGPMLSWQDQRTAADCATLAEAGVGDIVHRLSGLPLDPMFSALKARWLLDTYDPDRRRSRAGELCLGTVDSWLLHRLAGVHVTEVGNASRTQLLDLSTGDWSPQLLEIFGIPRAVLADVVASDGSFPATSGLAPLADGTPVLAVLGDSHAALFAHAGWRPGVVKATYGTGSSVMTCAAHEVHHGSGLCRTIAWSVSGQRATTALEGNIRSSGQTLVWLSDLFETTPEVLLDEAAKSSAEGVHLVPAFNGLGAPWWDSSAVAVIEGLTLGSRRSQLARAAVEAIVYQIEDVVGEVERVQGPVGTLLVDGGLSRNDDLLQLQADITGRHLSRPADHDLSALGVASLAGLKGDVWDRTVLEHRASAGRKSADFAPSPATSSSDRAASLSDWHAAVDRARGIGIVPVSRRSA
jgi:glycerol kinase